MPLYCPSSTDNRGSFTASVQRVPHTGPENWRRSTSHRVAPVLSWARSSYHPVFARLSFAALCNYAGKTEGR